ncbi:hypothetical protein [Neorhizobium vignae]|uniref:hypothetical protein n=1 Tax=Neorhizobium vignae TaxID=690585 RepID=UPI00055F4101|nr:hypothetical protein [Neorhizobium vignae]
MKAVFSGKLRRIAYAETGSLLDGLLVDQGEFREALFGRNWNAASACARFNIRRDTLSWLVKQGTPQREREQLPVLQRDA